MSDETNQEPVEVDPFDPDAYPEEARGLAQQAADRYRQAQEQAQRWEGIGQDPDFVREAVGQWEAIRDPQRHRQALDQIIGSYGLLPEGATIEDARRVIEWYQGLDDPGQEDQQAAGGERGLSQTDVQRMLDERFQAQQEDLDRKSQEDWGFQELTRQEDALRRQLETDGTDLGDAGWRALRGIVQSRLQSGDVTQQNFATTVQDSYRLLDEVASARAGAIVRKQASAPNTRPGEGAPGGTQRPVDGFDAMRARLQELWQEPGPGE